MILHIIGLILKIIGILLLVILGILLLVIGVLLFVPLRYELRAEFPGKLEDAEGNLKISWLLHLIAGRVEHGIMLRNTSKQDIMAEKEAKLTKQQLLVIQ